MKNDLHHPIEALGILNVSMNGVRIERLEDRIQPKVAFPHKHDFFQIILMTHGTGWHQIDFLKYPIKKHQLFIMKPGQVHSWHLNKNVKGLVIEFNRESMPGFNEQLFFSSDELVISKEKFNQLVFVSEIMHSEFNQKEEFYDLCLISYLSGFLIQLKRSDQRKEVAHIKVGSIIDRFRKLVEKDYRTQHRVEYYGKELKVSAKALTMQITRALGKSPREIIQERFLLEAKRLLAFSNLTVAEIGYELGFDDANYFSRFFRTHTKISPAQFRKKFTTR